QPPALQSVPTRRSSDLTSPGNQTGSEGSSVSLQITATDADGDALSYSATGLPAGLSVNPSTGLISGTLGNQAAGSYTVTVSATDDRNTTRPNSSHDQSY